jgi:DNA-binding NtrC family response regulator
MRQPQAISRKLLLIDDEASIREAIRVALEGQDVVEFEFFESSSVRDGLLQAQRVVPDIIILDLHMPDGSGFDFMDAAAQVDTLKDCRVVILTGDDTVENILAAQQKHISPYRFIGKPFNVSELQAIVLEAAALIKSV